MKSKFLFIIIIGCCLNAAAQNKRLLPADFTDNFSYTLPKSFDYTDSVQLRNEIIKIARESLRWQDSAFNNFSFIDTISIYSMLSAKITAQVVLQQNQQAIDNIIKARLMQPSPPYRSPYGLGYLAYVRAALQQQPDGSKTFADLLVTSFKKEYEMLDASFKDDIINQNKGTYNLASVGNSQKNLNRIFDQSLKNSDGKLTYGNAWSIIDAYWAYMLRKSYQPAIEKMLYTLNDAKVNEQKVKIPMRDGIQLNAYVYRNISSQDKVPAIVSLSPYPGGYEATRGNVFATNGYVYVYTDTRGRRESEGNFIPYEDDAHDFYDIIDWVSKQPWCNGKVATSGGSYLGFDQWQAIRSAYKHPALKAINPMVAVGFGVDFPRSSQMFYPYILQWATYVSGKELDDALFNDAKFWSDKSYALYKNNIPFNKLDSVAGMPNAVFQKWLSHPNFDSYWKNILPNEKDYAQLNIPVFSITGYYDADQNGAMFYYKNHMKYGNAAAKNNHYLLIGPYEHGAAQWQPGNIQNGESLEAAAQIPIYKYVIWWFDWVLKGKQKPAFIKDKITYFETGNNVWKGAASLKGLSKDSMVFYLTPAVTSVPFRKNLNLLSAQKPMQQNTLTYKQDIALAKDSAYLFEYGQPFSDSSYLASPYNLVFETPVFKEDIILSDKIITTINMRLNVPDADFACNIYEIAPDGKSRLIANDAVRVRYRNGGEKPQLAKPGENISLRFDNSFIYIKKINKGSKLRMEFELLNAPWGERNYGFGGVVSQETTSKPRIIEAKISTGGKNASYIVVPYGGH